MEDKLKEQLAKDCKFGCNTVHALTLPPVGVWEPNSWEPFTADKIKGCKALLFLDIMKGGLGVTFASGSGYLLAALPDGKWSSPYFIKLKQYGVGLTVGLDSISAVVVMNDEENIKKIMMDEGMKFGADLWITSAGTGGVGSSLGQSGWGENKTMSKNPDKLWAIQMGAMVFNVAMNGTETSPDAEMNAKVYGSATAEQVLSAPPTIPEVGVAFAPLYEKLAQL